jgi:hypothetical protein
MRSDAVVQHDDGTPTGSRSTSFFLRGILAPDAWSIFKRWLRRLAERFSVAASLVRHPAMAGDSGLDVRSGGPRDLPALPYHVGHTESAPNSIGSDRDHINAVGSHPLVHKIHQVIQPHLVPASTAVPTAAAKQQNEKHNDEKCGGIHVRFPRNAACCAAWNSGLLTTFGRPSGSRYSRGEIARS